MPTTNLTRIYPDMLVLLGGQWHVDYEGTQDEEFIRQVFGTVVLPTPYRIEWTLAEVMERISK